MKRALAVLILTTCAAAQSSGKPKLSADYAKAALKAVVAIANQTHVEDALTDAEVAAASKTDEGNLKVLQVLALIHESHISTWGSLREIGKMSGHTTEADMETEFKDSGMAADRGCIDALKASLRNRDAAQPKECK
jgi:hypothetical protein